MASKEAKILQRREYIENVAVVWLNNGINMKEPIEQLRAISNDIEVFDDADDCIDYITNLRTVRIILIISNMTNPCIFTLAQDLSAIFAVYILCLSNEEIEKDWSQSIRKIKGIYTDTDQLVSRIKFDLRRIEDEHFGFEVLETMNITYPSSRGYNKQECTFMHSQLLKEVFLRFEDDSTAELISYCRTIYANNSSYLAIINEFERQYDKSRAIWWYTKECFLYKLLNKALRTQQVEILYYMRTFIRHLHEQLVQLSPEDNHVHLAPTFKLYRGQRMSIREFDLKLKNNEGGLLSVSNFFSTSTNPGMALIYAGESDREEAAIIFNIAIDLNHAKNNPFACIERFSYFGDVEGEWLFSMGTVFRIGAIELTDKTWYVCLKLTDDRDETLGRLTIHMSKIIQLQRPNPLVPLCRLFARMDECGKAIELCKKHIKSENDWEMRATLYDTLAWTNAEDEDDVSALENHQRALNTIAEHVDANDPLLAYYHSNVAISCTAVNQYQQAIEHYKRAIQIEMNTSQPDYTNIAYCYESTGNILQYSFSDYNEALIYYERALELMLIHLPLAHPDTTSVYNEIANVYEKLNEFDKASSVLQSCIEQMEKNSECDPHDFAHTCEHIAEIYKKQKKFDEAAVMLNKCHTIRAVYPSSKGLDLENTDVNYLFRKLFAT
ncbi:unnamed protein product [Adineta ricciae]|uniref:Uncharacterized protein n=1 Tax=Adineta ricciae TaxID=249248 RepID=A0A815KBV0_ADIRI|nr:unnamed protein product [Adineta ricciae]CAF1391034.1 unnamed protein product [Adineta ricciae]